MRLIWRLFLSPTDVNRRRPRTAARHLRSFATVSPNETNESGSLKPSTVGNGDKAFRHDLPEDNICFNEIGFISGSLSAS